MKFRRLYESTTDKIIDAIKGYFLTSDDARLYGPIYILPDGTSVSPAPKSGSSEEVLNHADFEDYLYSIGLSNNHGSFTGDASPTLSSLGAIRCSDIEEENNYVELSKIKPSYNQYQSLYDWLLKNRYSQVAICTPNMNDFVIYDLDDVDYIINRIKRYYSSGRLYEDYELNEVYPNKGESKEDFISRFMRATVKEYPDKEQRFAVANSYWERRNKKGVSETFDVDGNLYNPSKYSGIEINDNFKKWFQKGGITDPYHDPLIVYHGSRYDFDSFVPNSYAGEFPDAVYFTDNKKIADTYGNTKEYFIRMQNPYYINARKKSFNDFYDEMLQEFNFAKDNGYDGVIVRDIKDDSMQKGSRLMGTTYAVFDPYNIKSISNSGKWDEDGNLNEFYQKTNKFNNATKKRYK